MKTIKKCYLKNTLFCVFKNKKQKIVFGYQMSFSNFLFSKTFVKQCLSASLHVLLIFFVLKNKK